MLFPDHLAWGSEKSILCLKYTCVDHRFEGHISAVILCDKGHLVQFGSCDNLFDLRQICTTQRFNTLLQGEIRINFRREIREGKLIIPGILCTQFQGPSVKMLTEMQNLHEIPTQAPKTSSAMSAFRLTAIDSSVC